MNNWLPLLREEKRLEDQNQSLFNKKKAAQMLGLFYDQFQGIKKIICPQDLTETEIISS